MKQKLSKRNHYLGLMKRAGKSRLHTLLPKKKREIKPKPNPLITLDEFDKLIRDGNQTIKETKNESIRKDVQHS